MLDQLAALAEALVPYEQIKEQLAKARARYRSALVLELFAQDVQEGLDAAMAEKRQELVRFVEGLWDKYRLTLTALRTDRARVEHTLAGYLNQLAYT